MLPAMAAAKRNQVLVDGCGRELSVSNPGRLDTVPPRLRSSGDPSEDIDERQYPLGSLLDLAGRGAGRGGGRGAGGPGGRPGPAALPKAEGRVPPRAAQRSAPVGEMSGRVGAIR